MSTVCIGDGLTTDSNGKLIVDEDVLARATLELSATQTVPAGANNTTTDVQIKYNNPIDVVNVTTSGNQLTIQQAGEYLLEATISDNPNVNDTTDVNQATIVGLDIRVNGTTVTGHRQGRLTGTQRLSCSRRYLLAVGDVVSAHFSIFTQLTNHTAHPLNASGASFLQVTQVPTKYVKPTA